MGKYAWKKEGKIMGDKLTAVILAFNLFSVVLAVIAMKE
jgi:hypothetical protein